MNIVGRGHHLRIALLADDPALCRRLEEEEVDAYDFTTICALYRPGREAGAKEAKYTMNAAAEEKGGRA